MRVAVSLRTRATALGTVAFAVLLAAGSVLLVLILQSRLTSASDELAQTRVDDLLTLARHGDLPRDLRNVDDDGVAQVVGPDGRVLAASANVRGRPAIASLRGDSALRVRTLAGPDDAETETYRTWYASGPSPDGRVTVYVGSSLESVSEASSTLRRSLWFGVPLAVLVLGLVIWWVIGGVLGRLDRIRAEVDTISEGSLDRRVAGDGVADEVGRLAATMNAMLTRLEGSSRRQRELVADVSHDLQSPLAAQRLALELALGDPHGVDPERLRADVLGRTAEMEGLVRDLLVLASVDAGVAPTPRPVDLDELVLEEAARARASATAVVDTSGVSAAPAFVDPSDVRRIASNLLDNALAHAATTVRLEAGTDGSWAWLEVADDGPGVPDDERERIFDRFHRADAARSRVTGSGLGLAIARELAHRSGGALELVSAPSGARFRLVLPAVPTS